MRIRPVGVHEINLVAEVHEQTACVAYAHIFPDQPFPREEILTRWQGFSGRIIVAVEDNAVVGFVAFDEPELHAFYVLPSYQGRGVGSQLLPAACTVSILWVLRKNHSARKFYEAHSWMAEGKKRLAFGAVEVLYCLIR